MTRHMGTYLNDHLAASVTAIKMLSHLGSEKPHNGLPRFAIEMRGDIEQDQKELRLLMRRLHIKKSRGRMATGWMAEKLSGLKLKLDDPGDHGLRTLEMLELLEIGIEGKRAMWEALAAVSEQAPALRGFDYERLSKRAQRQHARVERARLACAKKALAT